MKKHKDSFLIWNEIIINIYDIIIWKIKIQARIIDGIVKCARMENTLLQKTNRYRLKKKQKRKQNQTRQKKNKKKKGTESKMNLINLMEKRLTNAHTFSRVVLLKGKHLFFGIISIILF